MDRVALRRLVQIHEKGNFYLMIHSTHFYIFYVQLNEVYLSVFLVVLILIVTQIVLSSVHIHLFMFYVRCKLSFVNIDNNFFIYYTLAVTQTLLTSVRIYFFRYYIKHYFRLIPVCCTSHSNMIIHSRYTKSGVLNKKTEFFYKLSCEYVFI